MTRITIRPHRYQSQKIPKLESDRYLSIPSQTDQLVPHRKFQSLCETHDRAFLGDP